MNAQQHEEQYQNLLNFAADGVVLADNQGNIIYASDSMCSLVCMSRDELIGAHISLLPFSQKCLDDKPLPCCFEASGEIVISDRTFVFANGKEIRVEMKTRRLSNGMCQLVFCDITERAKAEEETKNLVAEKNLLLKEVHHRIKNNMSSIASLLSLQAGMIDDPLAVAALNDTEGRLQCMMLLYEKLYQNEDFIEISVGDYLSSLIDEIFDNLLVQQTVNVEKNIEEFNLSIKKMQPLGIILNELLTNIVKHAFPDTGTGLVSISVTLCEKRVRVEIYDNGIGVADTVRFDNSPGFGLVLISGLTKQLKGTIQFECENGTKTVLEFDR